MYVSGLIWGACKIPQMAVIPGRVEYWKQDEGWEWVRGGGGGA